MWDFGVIWMNPDVSKESSVAAKSITKQLTTKRRIPEHMNTQIYRCDYLEYPKIFVL